ncbi:MAG: sigma-70 family RNA polymerase sigma factor [Armatimonadota bacterium]|nr:MAG: sigma-70 family RNA polymerase sigma factor [Armatimonadota bacterium]
MTVAAAREEAVGTRRVGPADPDAGLLARCRRGDRRAFDVLLERHRARVLNLAYQMLGRPDEAQDAAQEALVRAFAGLKRFRGDALFATWLKRITINECLNRLSRRKPEVTLSPTLAGGRPADDGLLVKAAIANLSPPLRAALVLRELHGASYEEIAGILDIPVGTVRSRLAAAREKLREMLSEEA